MTQIIAYCVFKKYVCKRGLHQKSCLLMKLSPPPAGCPWHGDLTTAPSRGHHNERFSDVYKHSMRHCSGGKYSSEENQGETHNSDVSRNTSLSCRPSLRNRHNTTAPVNSAGNGDDEDPEKPTTTNIKKPCEVMSNMELFYDTFESTPDKSARSLKLMEVTNLSAFLKS